MKDEKLKTLKINRLSDSPVQNRMFYGSPGFETEEEYEKWVATIKVEMKSREKSIEELNKGVM